MRRTCRIGAVAYAWAPKGGKPVRQRAQTFGEGQEKRKKSRHARARMTRIVVRDEHGARSRVLRIIAWPASRPATCVSRPASRFVRRRIVCGKPCSTGCSRASTSARVLDLFAGSGALGLEALSRGAAHVTFVEKDRRAAAAIEAVAREWHEAVRAWCRVRTRSNGWRRPAPSRPFDIVFVDPPYDSNLQAAALERLCDGRLAPDARVYVERRARDAAAGVARGAGKSVRAGRAGEVGYHLFAT